MLGSMVGKRDRCWRTGEEGSTVSPANIRNPREQMSKEDLCNLAPDIPDWTSGVSGWCTCAPARLASAVYTDTENRRTSSDAHSPWQRWRGHKSHQDRDFQYFQL